MKRKSQKCLKACVLLMALALLIGLVPISVAADYSEPLVADSETVPEAAGEGDSTPADPDTAATPTAEPIIVETPGAPSETPPVYTVHFFVNGSELPTVAVATVDNGYALTEAMLPQNVYDPATQTFDGWHAGSMDGEKYVFPGTLAGDLSLYAAVADIPASPEGNGDAPSVPDPAPDAGAPPKENGEPQPTGEAPVDEPAPAQKYTVTLYVDGVAYGSPIVVGEDGTIPEQPAPPADAWPADAMSFRGWFTAPTGGDAFDFSTKITESMDLFAQFTETFLIEYMDAPENGKVIDTKEVAEGAVIPETENGALVSAPAGATLVGWYPQGGDPGQPIVFGASTATSDMRLLPLFSSEYYVVFHSDGTQVEPQMVKNGNSALAPDPAPTREGYEFSHWSLTPGGEAFSFETPITQNTDLYAVWQAKEVPYSVVYWLEKPGITWDAGTDTANYAYYKTESSQRSAVAGTVVDSLSAANLDKMPYAYYSHTVSPEILGNGLSVVNVYFKRTVYTLNFNFNAKADMTFLNDATLSNRPGQTFSSRYSFTAKYEGDIEKDWPSSWNATFQRNELIVVNGVFKGWKLNSDTTTFTTKRFTLVEDLVPSNLRNNGRPSESITFNAQWATTEIPKYVEYWVERLPGQTDGVSRMVDGREVWFVMDEALSHKVTLTKKWYKPSDWFTDPDLNPKELDSYTSVAKVGEGSQSNPFRFFYTRNRHTLTFDTLGGTTIPSATLMMGESLARYIPESPLRDGYLFGGWYYDAEYKMSVDFDTATMPDSNLAVFAKWESTECIVTFTDAYGGNVIAQQGVKSGGYVEQDMLNAIELDGVVLKRGAAVPGRGTFDGWYMVVGQSVSSFNPGMAIYSDLNVFAKWRTSGITLTYSVGAGSGTEPVDTNSYSIGARVRTAQPNGLVPPGGQVFLGWKNSADGKTYFPGELITLSGNTTLTAVYGSGQITLTFKPGYEGSGQADKSWCASAGQPLKLPDKNLFTREGERLVGWRVSGSEPAKEYAPGAAYTCPDADTTFEAVWSGPDRTVTFLAGENGKLTGRAAYGNIPNGSVWSSRSIKEPTPEADEGYYFYGWDTPLPESDAIIDSDMTFTAVFKKQTAISIQPGTGEWPYDGKAHRVDSFTASPALPEGDRLVVTMKEASAVTNVNEGKVVNAVATWKILRTGPDGSETDVSGKYAVTLLYGSLRVTPIAASVTPDAASKLLGTADPALTATATGFVKDDDIPAYTLVREKGEAVDTYTITATAQGTNPNYTITWDTGIFTIEKNPGLVIRVTGNSLTGTYGGDKKTATGFTTSALPEGFAVQATTSEATGTNVADASAPDGVPNKVSGVEVLFKGFDVTDDVTVEITHGKLVIEPIEAIMQASGANKVYNADDPVLTATPSGFLEGDAPDAASYTLVREEGEDVGTYGITFSKTVDVPNYDIKWLPGTFEITTGIINTAGLEVVSATKVYGEADPQSYAISGLPAGFTEGGDYEVAFQRMSGEDVRPGGYEVTVATLTVTNTNYTLQGAVNTIKPGALAITKRPVSITASTNQSKKAGEKDPASFNATLEKGALGTGSGFLRQEDQPTFTVIRKDGERSGDYDLTFANINIPDATAKNYDIRWVNGTFSITANPELTITLSAASDSLTYNGGKQTIPTTGFELDAPDGFTAANVSTTGAAATNVVATTAIADREQDRVNSIVGYDILFNGQPLSDGDVTVKLEDGSLAIEPKAASITVDERQIRLVGEPDPVFTAKAEGFVSPGHVPAYRLTREAGEASGKYLISFTNKGTNTNYNIDWNMAGFTIEPNRDLRVNVVGNGLSAVYDGTEKTAGGYTAKLGDGPLPAGYTVTADTTNPTATTVQDAAGGLANTVSNVQVSIGGYPLNEGDCTIATAPGVLNIAPAQVNIAGGNRSIRYGEPVPAVADLFTVEGKPAMGNDVVYTTAYDAPLADIHDAGNYGATASFKNEDNPNYIIRTTAAALTILPSDAAVVVTVSNASKVYGEPDPGFSATVDGLEDGDTLQYTLSRADGDGVGTYKITADVTADPNYPNVTVVDGTLTVQKRPAVLIANSYTIAYNGTVPTFTAYLGDGYSLAPGDTTLTYSVYRESTSTASGTYPILIALGDNPNYDIQTVPGTLTIQAAPAPAPAPADNPTPAQADTPAPAPAPARTPARVPAPAAPAADGDTIVPPVVPAATAPDEGPADPEPVAINPEDVPLAQYQNDETALDTSHWSLLNILAEAISLLLAVFTVIGIFIRRRGRTGVAGKLLNMLPILCGAVSVFFFLALGGISGSMVFVDKWTLFLVSVLVVQVLSLVALRAVERRGTDEADETE